MARKKYALGGQVSTTNPANPQTANPGVTAYDGPMLNAGAAPAPAKLTGQANAAARIAENAARAKAAGRAVPQGLKTAAANMAPAPARPGFKKGGAVKKADGGMVRLNPAAKGASTAMAASGGKAAPGLSRVGYKKGGAVKVSPRKAMAMGKKPITKAKGGMVKGRKGC